MINRRSNIKRVVMLLISCAVFLQDLAQRLFLHLIGKRTAGTCVVLRYHGIPAEQRARFARQMDMLCDIATAIRADTMASLAESQHHVALTFDEDLARHCGSAGYERVFSMMPVLALSNPREFVTGRVGVEPTDWPLEFWLKASGSYRWLTYAFRAKRALFRPGRHQFEGRARAANTGNRATGQQTEARDPEHLYDCPSTER